MTSITQNDLKEGEGEEEEEEEKEEEKEDFLCPLIKRMDFSPPLTKLLWFFSVQWAAAISNNIGNQIYVEFSIIQY